MPFPQSCGRSFPLWGMRTWHVVLLTEGFCCENLCKAVRRALCGVASRKFTRIPPPASLVPLVLSGPLCPAGISPPRGESPFSREAKYTASGQPRTTKQAKHLYDASPVCYGTRRCRLLHNLYQLDDCHLCCVTAARSNLHDLGVAALAVSILRCDFVKELLCNALLGYISHNLTL
mgnify:FL=1